MWPPTANLHADHDPTTGGYRGLAHGTRCPVCGITCNQSDGARRGGKPRIVRLVVLDEWTRPTTASRW